MSAVPNATTAGGAPPVRFDGRVVVITGGGGGLGRAYALAAAERGARVVVNDVGGDVLGRGASDGPAERVAAELVALGADAWANADDVATADGAERLVAAAVARFGRVDALVCNAGILRDRSFANMPLDDFERVLRVHLLGSVYACKAAWPHLRAQGYGRVVVTTSAAGLYGNFGQTNYAAAKLGLVGFMRALALEGAKYGVLANAVAPLAVTRLAAGAFPPGLDAVLTPGLVAPLVAYLCSEACATSGDVIAAGGGHFARVQVVEAPGVTLAPEAVTPEAVAGAWGAIADLRGARPFPDAQAAFAALIGAVEGARVEGAHTPSP